MAGPSTTHGGVRLHLATALTALLVWLPLVLFDANAPYDLPYFAVSSVLRRGLGLSALVGLGAALVTALLSSGVLALLPKGSGRAGAAGVPIVLALLVVQGSSAVNQWAAGVGAGNPVALVVSFLCATVLVLVLTFLLRMLPGVASEKAHVPLAALVGLCWAAVVANALSISFDDRRMLIIALSAVGLVARQLSVASRLAGAQKSAVQAAIVAGAIVALPLLVTLLAPFAVPRAVASPTPPESRDGPNVIIIMIDTLRADSTSLGSDDPDATPNLLALSRSPGSTNFARAIAAGSSTAPSVKAFFTSRSPSYWGLDETNNAPPRKAWRFVQSFAAAGYATAAISANPLVERDPYSGGFDYFWSAGGYRLWRSSFLLNVLLSGERIFGVFRRIEQLDADKISAATIRGVASSWLDARPTDAPFLLYLHFIDPHWPYYDRGYFEPSPRAEHGFSYVDYLGLKHGDPSIAKIRYGRNIRHLRHAYREEVRHMDQELGHLLQDLERRGLMDDSIVVILGDHGEEFLEHNGFSHGYDVYEEQVHVPLIVHWPRTAAFADMPARVEAPVSLLDLAPTLVDLLGLPGAPEDLDGRSLAPRLASRVEVEDAPPVTSEASMIGRSFFAYREGDLKARVQYEEDVLPWESDDLRVVDLAADPMEREELALESDEVESFLERARSFLRVNRRQAR